MTAPSTLGSSLRAPVARHADTIERIGRIGWVAKGVLYLSLALLVWRVAAHAASGDADQVGALSELSGGGWERALLVVVAGGLFLYAAWRLTEAVLARSEEAVERIGAAVSGLIHVGLGVIALRLVADGDSGTGGGTATDQRAAGFLEDGTGRVIIGLLGLVLVGVAVEQFRRAWTASFMRKLDYPELPGERPTIKALGRAGHAARGVVWAIVGGFLTVAAVQADPDDAKGLDGALREVAERSWGDVLLAVTAVGLALYGVYCILSARHQRLAGA